MVSVASRGTAERIAARTLFKVLRAGSGTPARYSSTLFGAHHARAPIARSRFAHAQIIKQLFGTQLPIPHPGTGHRFHVHRGSSYRSAFPGQLAQRISEEHRSGIPTVYRLRTAPSTSACAGVAGAIRNHVVDSSCSPSLSETDALLSFTTRCTEGTEKGTLLCLLCTEDWSMKIWVAACLMTVAMLVAGAGAF